MPLLSKEAQADLLARIVDNFMDTLNYLREQRNVRFEFRKQNQITGTLSAIDQDTGHAINVEIIAMNLTHAYLKAHKMTEKQRFKTWCSLADRAQFQAAQRLEII